MKKITFIFSLLVGFFSSAQNISTGVVTLTTGFTVQFDINATTNIVTMTMIGPSNVWLGVALNINSGNSMGSGGEDAIIFSGSSLSDRHMTGNLAMPVLDSSSDWNVSSNTINSGVRTIIATRARTTGDSNDFIFPTTINTSIPMLWAKGNNTLSLGYHGSRGAAVSTTLVTSDPVSLPKFRVYPNPVAAELTIEFPASIEQATVAVYSVLGTLVFQSSMNQWNSKINTSEWNTGVYLMNIKTTEFTQTKRVVKL